MFHVEHFSAKGLLRVETNSAEDPDVPRGTFQALPMFHVEHFHLSSAPMPCMLPQFTLKYDLKRWILAAQQSWVQSLQ